MKHFILLLIFCTSSFFAYGQKTYQDYWNDATRAFANGDYEKAKIDYQSYLVMGGPSRVDFITKVEKCKTLLSNANVLFDARNYSEAKAKYQELIALNPSDSNAQKRIAECNNRLETKPKREQQSPQSADPQSTSTTKREQKPPQPPKYKKYVCFGIKGGPNFSNITNKTPNIEFSPKINTGFHSGFLFNIRKPIWGIQPELLYSQQGFVIEGSKINFHYITVPLMFKYYIDDYFIIELGPFFSYLFAVAPNSMEINVDEYDFYSTRADINFSDLKKGKDIGFAVGAGFEFDILSIGVRYNRGLSDMANNLQWKNSVFAISLGIFFNK
ncbi:MAG: PorT family protein [Marinilabiliaceae bacterium]|nr:PorT family protein [Marinilabiliaceae bacterium]